MSAGGARRQTSSPRAGPFDDFVRVVCRSGGDELLVACLPEPRAANEAMMHAQATEREVRLEANIDAGAG